MVSKLFLGVLSFLLVCSCAQVGQLTGGDLDRKAPEVIRHESDTSGQLNFTKQEIKLVFDEYIQLFEADQRIQLIPNDAKLHATVQHKTLHITWQDILAAKTTYVISLNHAVKDLTEGNDSLIQVIFSTGPIIDSLAYTCSVIDAKTRMPLTGILVGLFPDETATQPTYFTMTNTNGIAKFNYLKSGKYWVRGVQDSNKDLTIQNSEKQGFKPNELVLTSSLQDSLPIRLYVPKPKKLIADFSFIAPGLFSLKTNIDKYPESIQFNGKILDSKHIIRHRHDSLSILPGRIEQEVFQLILIHQGNSDTVSKSFLKSEKQVKNTLHLLNNQERLLPNERIILLSNDYIDTLLSNKIRVINQRDSAEIPSNISYKQNQITIDFAKAGISHIRVLVAQDAVLFSNQTLSEAFDQKLELIQEEETGSMHIKPFNCCGKNLMLEVNRDGKHVMSVPIQQDKGLTFNNLIPGNYTFSCFNDINDNAVWDVGNWETKTEPEHRWMFQSSYKLRANWESEITLTIP